jgi:alpha-galactosidase
MVFLPAAYVLCGQQTVLDVSRYVIRGQETAGVRLTMEKVSDVYRPSLSNEGPPARIDEVVICDIPIAMPGETKLYGEGFTMLSQTGGTIADPVDIGAYTDHGHYKMPTPVGATTVYGVLALTPPGRGSVLLGFTTCRRFSGHFNLFRDHVEVVIDTEGLTLQKGEVWRLEDFVIDAGDSLPALFSRFGDRIAKHAGKLRFRKPPTGWCSWQCFGPEVTSKDVQFNVEAISKNIPALKYVQIDDGYQAKTGDWLETGSSFGGGIRKVLEDIRAKGLEPAIWVAPFVATEDSKLFQEHPDWFVQDDAGKPLRSDRVTFGGWHKLPWYVLDGTNPGAQGYLEHVFHTMRTEWDCTYFKMDAIAWGAIKGGHFHDPRATRIEAFHRGMEAIRRGAGDGFLLGCNHPVWPSIGFVDGQRSGMDIDRSWQSFSSTAKENLCRAWQNGKLWWNDPDTLLLTGDLPANEFQFHASVILATGGLVLSGDDIPKLKPAALATIKKLLPPSGVAAQFEDDTFAVGSAVVRGQTRVFLFNWTDLPASRTFAMKHEADVKDFWTGADFGTKSGTVTAELPPRSARVLVYR